MTKTARNTRTSWLLNLTILAIALIIFAMASCSPERRLHNIIERNPHLMDTDTVTVHDSIWIPSVHVDTFYRSQVDTMIIRKDNLTIKHYYDRTHDTHYLSGECRDTVHHYTRDTITRTVTTDSGGFPWWGWVIIVGMFILVLLIRR